MLAPDDGPPGPARHAAPAIGAIAIGAVVGALSLLGGLVAGVIVALLIAAYGVLLLRVGPTVQCANLAGAAINRGDLDEARAWLAEARTRPTLASTDRLLDSHEAEIAWRVGDVAAVRTCAERGLARPRGILPAFREMMLAHLHAERALAAAATGDHAAAQASIEAVRANDAAGPTPAARAELAAALGWVDDVPRLRAHLAEHHVLLGEGLDPRSRTLHRALRRLVVVHASTAYRVAASDVAARPGTTRSWLARVFPTGQDLVDQEEPAVAEMAAPAGASPAPLPEGRRRGLGPLGRVLVVWAALVGVLVLLWTLTGATVTLPSRTDTTALVAGSVAFVVLVGGLMAWTVIRSQRAHRVLLAAQRALLSGRADEAEAAARPLCEHQDRVVGATAAFVVATALERRGRTEEALRACDAGISRLTGLARTAAVDVGLPQLVGLRAHLFGVLGRDADSDAELARLARDFPAFPYAPGWQLRTRLLRAVRAGDLEAARTLARGRGDVAIGGRAELVAELLLADEADDRDARLDAVREDLARSPEVEAWLRRALPGFLEKALRVRVAPPPTREEDDEEALEGSRWAQA